MNFVSGYAISNVQGNLYVLKQMEHISCLRGLDMVHVFPTRRKYLSRTALMMIMIISLR
jgi:hypothetical protein